MITYIVHQKQICVKLDGHRYWVPTDLSRLLFIYNILLGLGVGKVLTTTEVKVPH